MLTSWSKPEALVEYSYSSKMGDGDLADCVADTTSKITALISAAQNT